MRRKLKAPAHRDPFTSEEEATPLAEDLPADPFADEELKPRDRRKVYHPRRMRWEYEDGTPVDGPERVIKERRAARDIVVLFPFGEYKGASLEEVPSELLRWTYSKFEDRGNGLHEAIEAELNKRGEG
jgi:uncharacterized protein (DUF3820 family)